MPSASLQSAPSLTLASLLSPASTQNRVLMAGALPLMKLVALLVLSLSLVACPAPDVNSDWMAPYQDRTLGELTWVQSHDAGMYKAIPSELMACKGGAFYNIALTQKYDILGQLKAGVRKFDIRPVLHAGRLYTAHGTRESIDALGLQLNAGCRGQEIDALFKQVHDFLLDHPTEVVMLEVSHIGYMTGMFSAATAADVAEGVKQSAEAHLGDLLFRPSGFPVAALQQDAWDMKLGDFVAANQRAILTMECEFVEAQRGAIGCLSAQNAEPFAVTVGEVVGSWLNTPFPEQVIARAEDAYRDWFDSGDTIGYEMSWTATQDQNCVAASIVYKLLNRPPSRLSTAIKDVLASAGIATEGYDHCRSIQTMSGPLHVDFAARIEEFKQRGLFCAQRKPRVISMDFVDGNLATPVVQLNDAARYPDTGVCD